LDKKVLSGWQTKQDKGGNLILSFEQEKIVQKHSWTMLFIYAILKCFVLIGEGTGAQAKT